MVAEYAHTYALQMDGMQLLCGRLAACSDSSHD